MAFDKHNTLGYSTVASVVSQVSPTLIVTVQTGDGANFSVNQQVIIWPAAVQALLTNAMIGRITAIATDQLTIDYSSTNKEGTSNRTVQAGDQICNAETVKTFADIETPLLTMGDFVQSGATIGVSASLTQTLAAGVAWINNQKVTIATDGGHAYTASKDTYVDTDNTGAITYTAVTLGAAAPALAANSIRLAKVVTNGSQVTSALQDGSYDSLGNKIYPTTPLTHANYQNINLPEGYLLNGKIVTSVASNNLTVAIKTMAGLDADSSHPIYVRVGNTIRAITAALSVTKNAGTNWFNSGGADCATQEIDYFVYLGYNATDGVTLGFARFPGAVTYNDFNTTTTNDHYAAISTITNAASTDNYVNIGRFNAILSATASFNWSLPGTSIVINRPIFETRWLTWAPTLTSGMTLSSIVTNLAKYRIQGNTMHFIYDSAFTTGGGATQSVAFTIPLTITNTISGSGNVPCDAAAVTDGGLIGGFFILNTSTSMVVKRYDGSAFGIGAGKGVSAGTIVGIL